MVFYFPRHRQAEFLEFLGKHPSYYEQLQASDSIVCRLYALFYALSRSRNIPTSVTINSFVCNKDAFDERVYRFITSYMCDN